MSERFLNGSGWISRDGNNRVAAANYKLIEIFGVMPGPLSDSPINPPELLPDVRMMGEVHTLAEFQGHGEEYFLHIPARTWRVKYRVVKEATVELLERPKVWVP